MARDIGPGPSGRIPAIIRELEEATVEIARLVEEFLADTERRAQDFPDEERERTIERLRQARP